MPALASTSRPSILDELDRAMARLADAGGLPEPDDATPIWEGIRQEETHHSTALAGNTLTLAQVKALLEHGRAVGNKRLAEYLEVLAYAEAAQWVYARAATGAHSPGIGRVSLRELQHIHRLAVEPVWRLVPSPGAQPDEGPGSFRRQDVGPLASGDAPSPWAEVPALVSDWLTLANAKPPDDTHLVVHLADVHSVFEWIHPFLDGNGRTGRLVLDLMLVRSGYPPAIIPTASRTRYLEALRGADEGDARDLGDIVARGVAHGIDRFVLPGQAGPQKMVALGALASAGISSLALRRAAERGRLQATKRNAHWLSTKGWVEEYRKSRKRGRRPAGG